METMIVDPRKTTPEERAMYIEQAKMLFEFSYQGCCSEYHSGRQSG